MQSIKCPTLTCIALAFSARPLLHACSQQRCTLQAQQLLQAAVVIILRFSIIYLCPSPRFFIYRSEDQTSCLLTSSASVTPSLATARFTSHACSTQAAGNVQSCCWYGCCGRNSLDQAFTPYYCKQICFRILQNPHIIAPPLRRPALTGLLVVQTTFLFEFIIRRVVFGALLQPYEEDRSLLFSCVFISCLVW
jgi:hypothetical protein